MQYTTGAQQIVAAHPRVLKILDTHASMLAAARDFKAGTPDGQLVLRIYTARRYTLADDPAASAQDFWNAILAPPINALSPSDRALIDYVEGPNEGDSTPTWATLQEAQWFNSFWMTLAPLIGNAGFKPCAFSIAVGNPPGDTNYVHQVLDTIVPALRLCKSYNGGWAYHSYTLPYTKDVATEIWYSLRYRQYYSYFAQYYPDLNDLPLILNEGGVDGQTAPGGPGWKAYDAARYQDWLAWFDQQLMQDPYVVGCTLFQSGDPSGWFSFDLEPIAPWLADHLATTLPPGPPPTPADFTAVASAPRSVQLNWSASAGAIRYNVKRSGSSGGPYAVISTPTATTYTDGSLTLGNTYCYAVSAVNTDGESANSDQAAITITGACAVNSGAGVTGPFAADAWYNGGNTHSTTAAIDTTGVINPAPDAVYRSERWSSPSFTYTFTGFIPGTPHTVRLHFAEIYYSQAGQRRFNVAINGAQVLTDFDIVAAAGAANKALVRTFPVNAGGTGQILIQYSAGPADNPKSSGIEIQPLPPTAPTSLTATPGDAQVALSWTASAGATGYNVKRSTATGGPYGTLLENLAATTYTDMTVTNGTPYYYVVSAVNHVGEGADSDEAGATPRPPFAPGDIDHDDDVDLSDFASFQLCFNGPNQPPKFGSACSATDLDHDGDVDLIDFSIFQTCFNGPNRTPRCG